MISQVTPMLIAMCAIGGAFGAVSRMLIAIGIASFEPDFPYATLLINVLGCFGIGLLIPLAFDKALLGPNLQALFIVGFLGAFTTFSTFTFESVELLKSGAYTAWVSNVCLNIFLCLAALFFALKLVK